jgi:hypothetical protein
MRRGLKLSVSAMAEAADVIEVPRNNDGRRNRPSSRSRKNRIIPREVFPLDREMVRDKHPNNQSKKAPVVEMTLLIWEILYNGGQRVAEILRRYPDLLDKTSLSGVPPIGAAVYMNDLQSAEILLKHNAGLMRLYSFSKRHDGYHAINTTPIVRAMITPGREDMLGLLLHFASTEDKLAALDNLPIRMDGLKEHVMTLAKSLSEDAQFSNRTVVHLIESTSRLNDFDQDIIDAFGDKFPNFLRNRTLVVSKAWKQYYYAWIRTLENYIKKKYKAVIDYTDNFMDVYVK